MNDQSWQIVEHVFNIAIEMPARKREAYLDEACLSPSIRAEVESLIAAEEKAQSYFERQIAAAASEAAGQREQAQKKRIHRLGPYRIVRSLRAGAQLFVAERDDGERVAVRVLRTESDDGRARAAPLQRRLESLEHPNIIRVLDGGVTPKGAPYCVTELVEYESFGDWCDREKLSIERRIELFLRVCRAVHFGHQRLLLHGALDAANLRVAPDGAPKLADFGLAVLEDAAEEPASHRPRRAAEYASPEELRGEPASTSSEVYSLGVLLYELLCAHKPFHLRESSRVEIERIVNEMEPAPPSQAVRGDEGAAQARACSSAQLERKLGGALDSIVMRAMRKAPAHRYASAAALADDLESFLQGRPPAGAAAQAALRAPRWVQFAVAAAVALLALVAVWGWVSARRADGRAALARQAQLDAQSTAGFLTGLFGVADPRERRAASVTAREALDWGAARIAREMPQRPRDQALVMAALSQAYLELGLLQPALALAEEANRRAESAPALLQLGRVRLAEGHSGQAVEFDRKAVALLRDAGPGDPAALASALDSLAVAFIATGDFGEAEAPAREALALRQSLSGERDLPLASSFHTLGAVERRLGRVDEAESDLRRAFELRHAALGDLHLDTAATLSELGGVLRAQGKLEEAEDALGKALSATLEVRGERSPAAADSLRALAVVLSERGRPNEAREMLQVALEVDRSAFGPSRPQTADDLEALGKLAEQRADLDEARRRYREALELHQQAGRADDAARLANELARLE
ncbi:MAG: tetratricopeptide repeat protein [Bryobacterales bacterium]|nr:tetratricopeptide repeat protein [Acidobacteriota bacterium]MCB9383209.1 tetratricopeptide repeat protein [Bryobacterales bacterium]